jgi:hypothetical protein
MGHPESIPEISIMSVCGSVRALPHDSRLNHGSSVTHVPSHEAGGVTRGPPQGHAMKRTTRQTALDRRSGEAHTRGAADKRSRLRLRTQWHAASPSLRVQRGHALPASSCCCHLSGLETTLYGVRGASRLLRRARIYRTSRQKALPIAFSCCSKTSASALRNSFIRALRLSSSSLFS